MKQFVGKTYGDGSKQSVDKEESPADKGSHDHPTDQSDSSIPVSSSETDMPLPVMSLMVEHLVFSSNSSFVMIGQEASGIRIPLL